MATQSVKEVKLIDVILFLFSVLNLIYMHYYVFYGQYMEVPMFVISPLLNFSSVLLDVSLVFLFFGILMFRKSHLAILFTFVVTLLWSFANIFYCRFFGQYLSLSAMGQAHSLTDGLVVNSMLSGFQCYDLYYVFIAVVAFCLCNYWGKRNKKIILKSKVRLLLLFPLVLILVSATTYTIYHFSKSATRNNFELYLENLALFTIGNESGRKAVPNLYRYHDGCMRTLGAEMYGVLFPMVLTDDERSQIKNAYSDLNCRVSKISSDSLGIKNVVFILLESFMSSSSDLIVDGKRVTPFLDSLKSADNVYYNGHVAPNITVGESGDGQFIYLTGLLPTRSQLVLAEAKDNVLPALPMILRNFKGIRHSEIIIPTVAKVWDQDKMNIAYGFDKMYNYHDVYNNKDNSVFLCLNDEEVFNLAINSLSKESEPFFSLILSASTHMPYNSFVDSSFVLHDNKYPREYLYYLNACHYVDKHLRRYVNQLKKQHLYESTLLFIMADHNAHIDALNMRGKIEKDIPLYIVNGGFDKNSAYSGSCNQLDIYTTLLDILNIDSSWHGLGNSLLFKDYKNSVSPSTYDLSEKIVYGDFFRDEDVFVSNK